MQPFLIGVFQPLEPFGCYFLIFSSLTSTCFLRSSNQNCIQYSKYNCNLDFYNNIIVLVVLLSVPLLMILNTPLLQLLHSEWTTSLRYSWDHTFYLQWTCYQNMKSSSVYGEGHSKQHSNTSRRTLGYHTSPYWSDRFSVSRGCGVYGVQAYKLQPTIWNGTPQWDLCL